MPAIAGDPDRNQVWRCAVIRRVFSPLAKAKACIRLDLPVPFAPRMKSISPTFNVMAKSPVGLPVGIDNENGMIRIHDCLGVPPDEASLAEQRFIPIPVIGINRHADWDNTGRRESLSSFFLRRCKRLWKIGRNGHPVYAMEEFIRETARTSRRRVPDDELRTDNRGVLDRLGGRSLAVPPSPRGGNRLNMMFTRFCTFTTLMFGSVPGSK